MLVWIFVGSEPPQYARFIQAFASGRTSNGYIYLFQGKSAAQPQTFPRFISGSSGFGKAEKREKASDRAVDDYETCPIDSTVITLIITLISKLLWALGYHQVKLFSVAHGGNHLKM
ncbi:hypothetical protein [Parathermosynechococcus lividus]